MQSLESLIDRAKTILPEPHPSTKYELWKHDVHSYVETNYGADLVKILDRTLRPSQVFKRGDNFQAMRNERVQRAIEFLEELKDRDAETDLATSNDKNMGEAKKAVQERLSSMKISVSGNASATFGDNSPLNQIQVGEFMTALIQEVEAMPESPEKQSLLQQLKAITENPTFAAIAGGAVGGIVQSLVK